MSESNQGLAILRLSDVRLKIGGRSRSWIYAKISRGEFPAPVRIGDEAQASGWISSEIDRWILDQIERRDQLQQAVLPMNRRRSRVASAWPFTGTSSTPIEYNATTGSAEEGVAIAQLQALGVVVR